MKHLWLVLFTLAGCTQLPPTESSGTSYVHVTSAGPYSFTATVSAPPAHALLFENCNGAINWALAVPGAPTDTFAWVVQRNACLSEPIKIEPGSAHTFKLRAPSGGTSAPASGQYHLVLLGVFSSWSQNQPLHQPQVPRAHLTSDVVSVGQ